MCRHESAEVHPESLSSSAIHGTDAMRGTLWAPTDDTKGLGVDPTPTRNGSSEVKSETDVDGVSRDPVLKGQTNYGYPMSVNRWSR